MDFRTLVLNLGIFGLVFLLAYVYVFRNPPAIVIGSINVVDFDPSFFPKAEELHSRITQAFRGAFLLGGAAMPEEVVTDSIDDEANQLDFEIPELGVSFKKLINYLPQKLGFDGSATVTGSLAPTEQGDISLHAELAGPDGTVAFDGTGSQLDVLFLNAASELLRNRYPYVYASALSVQERQNCYADGQNCDFPKATLAYQSIYDYEATGKSTLGSFHHSVSSIQNRRYVRWALLAVSKIREDQGDYEGEIEFAKQVTTDWPRFSWGYYNWGVALTELGCYDGAIRAFSRTISLQPSYASAYNARGRIHLFLAEAFFLTNPDASQSERRKALRDFQTAISLNSAYAEAQINLGKAHRLDLTEQRQARAGFEAAIEIPNSPHAARAYQQLAIWERIQGNDAKYLDDMSFARRAMADKTVCRFNFSNSLKDALGCMELPEEKRLLDLSASLACRRHIEGLPVAQNDVL